MSSRPNGGAQTAAPKRRRPEVTYSPPDLKPKFDYNRPMIVVYLKLLLVIYNITSIFTRLKLYARGVRRILQISPGLIIIAFEFRSITRNFVPASIFEASVIISKAPDYSI